MEEGGLHLPQPILSSFLFLIRTSSAADVALSKRNVRLISDLSWCCSLSQVIAQRYIPLDLYFRTSSKSHVVPLHFPVTLLTYYYSTIKELKGSINPTTVFLSPYTDQIWQIQHHLIQSGWRSFANRTLQLSIALLILLLLLNFLYLKAHAVHQQL